MMEKLIALRDMLKAATAPSRELDCRVWCATAGNIDYDTAKSVVPNVSQWVAPYYTADLNAALFAVSLAKAANYNLSYVPSKGHTFGFFSGFVRVEATGSTAALAICIAVIEHKIKTLESEAV